VEYKSDKARDLTCTVKQAYGLIRGTLLSELLLTLFVGCLLAVFHFTNPMTTMDQSTRLTLVAPYQNHSKKVWPHHVARLVNYSDSISAFGQAKVVQVAITSTDFVVSFYSIIPTST
jgi:hypothetical protein